MRVKILTTLLLGSVCFASPANATLVTSDSFTNSSTVDFSDQPDQINILGPVQIGNLVGEDITVASSSATNDLFSGLYFNYSSWGLCDNGTWGSPQTYVSLNGSNDVITFAFNDGPVSSVGGFMNYAICTDTDFIITALDADMNILESYNLTSLADIITPQGFNDGAFRGITRATDDISYFRLSGGLANALDDLTFSREGISDIPEPAPLALLGLGLLGLGLRRKRLS